MYPGTHHAAVFEKEKAGKPESWICKNGENPEHLAGQGDRGSRFFAGGKWELPEDKCPFLTYEFMENS